MNDSIDIKTIEALVATAVESYAQGFQARHEGEIDNPEGTINMKIHNVFIEALGKDIQYYAALVRSLDSSLGNMLESLAINIAKLGYDVQKQVEGPLYSEQTHKIADFLEQYNRRERIPEVKDLLELKNGTDKQGKVKRHVSDYYLFDKDKDIHYLIELKIGGDLDNKKARSEKEAIMEQFAILSNTLHKDAEIKTYFATAYNRFGEDKPWNQQRVRQFFAEDELLIGRDFWNFICKSQNGYEIVLNSYRENSHFIKSSLDSIRKTYLGS